jgi:hypothetical protein
VVRRVLVVDALRPYPAADLRVRVRADDAVRRARVAERDLVGRWNNLELTARAAPEHDGVWDVHLDGAAVPAANARLVIEALRARHPGLRLDG